MRLHLALLAAALCVAGLNFAFADSECADSTTGCDVELSDIAAYADSHDASRMRVYGWLERRSSSWGLVSKPGGSQFVELDMPESLVERLLHDSNGRGETLPLVRVSGATVVKPSATNAHPTIVDFSFVQTLASPEETQVPETLDGRDGTRCSFVFDLLGDYCLVTVGLLEGATARYEGARVSLLGYLRCDAPQTTPRELFASRSAAEDRIAGEAVVIGDDWTAVDARSAQICRETDKAILMARVVGRFRTSTVDADRRDRIGLVTGVEKIWALEPL